MPQPTMPAGVRMEQYCPFSQRLLMPMALPFSNCNSRVTVRGMGSAMVVGSADRARLAPGEGRSQGVSLRAPHRPGKRTDGPGPGVSLAFRARPIPTRFPVSLKPQQNPRALRPHSGYDENVLAGVEGEATVMEYTVESLCNQVARNRLLAPDAVRSMRQRWRDEAKAAADDAGRFCKWMIASGYLTAFQ